MMSKSLTPVFPSVAKNPEKPISKNKAKIIAFSLTACILLLIIVSCTPTIRYASKTDIKTSSASTGKSQNYTNKYFNSESYNLNTIQKKIIETARSYLGVPYCWGGASVTCFDCSGFVSTVFAQNGIELPRVSGDIFIKCHQIGYNSAQAADIVFFGKSGSVSHVGIYLGNGEFIHASTSQGVMISSLNEEYFSSIFICFGRILNEI